MPPKTKMYLCRVEDSGKMFTVLAGSVRAAIKLFRAKYRPAPGTIVSVKERGGTEEWIDFKVYK